MVTIPVMQNQMIVSVEDTTMMKEIRKAISMVRGVTKVSIPRRKRYSSYELSQRDIAEGHVNSYHSVDDFFKHMGL